MPPPSAKSEIASRAEFLEDLALFAEAEARLDPTRTPIGFEVAFGRATTAETTSRWCRPIRSSWTSAAGATLRIAGRIDRIDELGAAAVRDRRLQDRRLLAPGLEGHVRRRHAPAARALRACGRRAAEAEVQEGGGRRRAVLLPQREGPAEAQAIPAQSLAATAGVLADLREVIASGLFVHAQERQRCKFCDYGHACGKNAHDARDRQKAGGSVARCRYRKLRAT